MQTFRRYHLNILQKVTYNLRKILPLQSYKVSFLVFSLKNLKPSLKSSNSADIVFGMTNLIYKSKQKLENKINNSGFIVSRFSISFILEARRHLFINCGAKLPPNCFRFSHKNTFRTHDNINIRPSIT